jgi:phosphoribosylamine--glycine ligase
MGTVAPNPYYTADIAEVCMKEIFVPTINAMNAEGRTFKGCLYFGLMLTENGPKVIEYNCRFGDPETQVVLPLLKSDLLTVMMACREGTLDTCEVEFENKNAVCVVMASNGYPQKYESGFEITVDDGLNAEIYYAGAKCKDGKLVTAGGRVLGVVAKGDTLADAIKASYAEAKKVHFANSYMRSDIGARALKAIEG